MTTGPVICCPNRLYGDNYQILKDVSEEAFGSGVRLVKSLSECEKNGRDVVVFGKRWGRELRLPGRGPSGRFFVDWILALISEDRKLREFVAVEVQTMDTTGSYRKEIETYYRGAVPKQPSVSGINWENVSKRILPQIIHKGHVLRREPLCTKGLFFICPKPVYEKIITRLGGSLENYHPQSGALTFRWYDLGSPTSDANPLPLQFIGQKTTVIDQVALAFTSPSNLPPAGVYAEAINNLLHGGRGF